MASTSRAAHAQRKPDVFLNFRGKDTRNNFISHLLVAMVRNGISAYTDHKLRGGEEISPTLSDNISESPVSVAVFSPNYADSRWCLDELVQMIQSKGDNGQEVLPVFLQGVEPTHVRHQTGPFGDGFEKLIQEYPTYQSKKEIWEDALKQAANLSSGAFEHSFEAEIIEKLVKRILSILGKMCSSDYGKGFFGTHRIGEVESIMFSEDMNCIGIWGMGGSGKTTLAQKIRDRYSSKFQGVCFIENVREHAERGQLDCLQEKLLSKLLGKCQPNEPPQDIHDNNTKFRLSRITVLIILDDISDAGQIEAVIGDFTNFRRGSKMIAISRDRQVLKNVCDDTYEVQRLDDTDSLQLLKHIMFKQRQPTLEQMVLLQETIMYAQGLPLALVVLGRNFYNKGITIWRSELMRLNNVPVVGIMKILRISFDGLEDMEKNIFLDIACLLHIEWGCHMDIILKAHGYCSLSIIDHLVDKALITINFDNSLGIHDLLRQMGNEIGKDSRLWKPKEIVDVLSKNEGSSRKRKIEVISSSYLYTDKRITLLPDAFKEMTSLRILHFPGGWGTGHILLPEGLEVLPNELRWLKWNYYPGPSLPLRVDLENLVELRMRESKLVELWSGELWLPSLKCIDVSCSTMLTKLPNLGGAPKLEKLWACLCDNLEEIPNSVGHLVKLKVLSVLGDKRLTRCPDLSELRELERLNFDGCCSIIKLPQLPQNLVSLHFRSTRVEELPLSQSTRIEELALSQIPGLSYFGWRELKSPGNSGCSKLQGLQSLKELNADNYGLICLPDEIKYSTNLQVLDLSCTNLESLAEEIKYISNLRGLDLSLTHLKSLPNDIKCIKHLVNLKQLDSSNTNLRSLPEEIKHLTKLQRLYLCHTKLERLPEGIQHLANLKTICLSHTNLKSFPDNIKHLANLGELGLCYINLESLPQDIHKHFPKLWSLHLCCTKLKSLPDGIKHLANLTYLYLFNTNLESVPEDIQRMSHLKLYLSHADLEHLPDGLKYLADQKALVWNSCGYCHAFASMEV